MRLSSAAKILGTKPSEECIAELDVLREVMLEKLAVRARDEDQPVEAPIVLEIMLGLLRSGSLEYGLVWIPLLVRLLDADPDRIYDALQYLYDRDFVELYWPPGTYREDNTFELGPTVSAADAKMLRPGLSGGMIGYARVHNGHPHRVWNSSRGLYPWRMVVEKGRKEHGLGPFKKPTSYEEIHEYLAMGSPLVVSWGLGRDSTGVLVEFVRKNIIPTAIVYAEVGCEKPDTYTAKKYFEKYLAEHDFPRVQTVKYVMEDERYHTLEQECLGDEHYPAISYNFQHRDCSVKWKIMPQEKFISGIPLVQEAWRRGLPVVQMVGFDNSKADLKRSKREIVTPQFVKWYPLQEWGWDLERTIQEIKNAGLKVPPKSACFMCASTQPDELLEFLSERPEYISRIAAIEEAGEKKAKTIKGLWGSTATKAKPASWIEYLRKVADERIAAKK